MCSMLMNIETSDIVTSKQKMHCQMSFKQHFRINMNINNKYIVGIHIYYFRPNLTLSLFLKKIFVSAGLGDMMMIHQSQLTLVHANID